MNSMMASFKKSGSLELMGVLLAEKTMPTMPDKKRMLGEGSAEQPVGEF